jgi:CBS domain-containing protein
LGSGTSGGVLAPLLLIGGALGGLEAHFLPGEGMGFWPLISMGAVLGGTMRSPFTGVIFALELTHDVNALLPLLLAVTVSHGVTVLTMRRSILTEKVSRRGYHLSREYAVDPLEILFVRDVMRTNILAFPASITLKSLEPRLANHDSHGQRLYPVVDESEHMVGVLTSGDLRKWAEQHGVHGDNASVLEVARPNPVSVYPDEPLTVAANRMAETGLTRFPVVDRADPNKLLGIFSFNDLLKARLRSLAEERQRERVLRLRILFPTGLLRRKRKLPAETEPEPQSEDVKGSKPAA